MKLISVPSLQHLTAIKIAIELWNQIDLRESIVNLKINDINRFNWQDWQEVEEKALDKVAQLSLPKQLKREFLSVISPIGVEIRTLWMYHRQVFHLSKLPNRLVWTSRGTIDKLKTAECLLKDEVMDVYTRYEISCVYCLEDVIAEAWNQIDKQHKQRYFKIWELKHPFLTYFWAYYLSGRLSELVLWRNKKMKESKSPYLMEFQLATMNGNKVAVEFFFAKLTNQEKNRHLYYQTKSALIHYSGNSCYQTTPKQLFSEVFFFLLSRMSKGQRENMFQNNPHEMLLCLLEWPNRALFVELAERTIHSNPYDVLELIIENIANGWSDCTSRQLFHYFWNLCPLSCKRRVIEGIDYYTVMKLYERNDVEIVRALFQHACAEEKEELIMCRREIDISALYLVRLERWEPLEEAVAKFRDEFLER